jgi:hypothetical protein
MKLSIFLTPKRMVRLNNKKFYLSTIYDAASAFHWFYKKEFIKIALPRLEYYSQKHKSGRGPSSEHFWQVWLISVQRFQRRRFKYEKLTDGRMTDAYP